MNGHLVISKYKNTNDIDMLVIEDDAFINKTIETISDIKAVLTHEQYNEYCMKVGEQ